MELLTPLETICRLIGHAREREAQVSTDDADEAEDPNDGDEDFATADDEDDDAADEEMLALLDDLTEDQLQEILALAWVGRGTYDASEWDDALEEAADPDGEDPVDQLLDLPTLAAYLDAGLAAFDLSCEGVAQSD